MKIIHTLTKIALNVTFSDGSVKVLHGQSEDNKSWTLDQAESFETARQLSWYTTYGTGFFGIDYPYYDALAVTILRIPWVKIFDFDYDDPETLPKVQKKVTDVIGTVEVTLAFDDNRYTSATVVMSGLNSSVYFGGNAVPAASAAVPTASFIASFGAALRKGIEEVDLG